LNVPDPYYGGDDGFEKVYQMLLRSCEGLLAHAR
jgi:protein-tyrosine phosphatase